MFSALYLQLQIFLGALIHRMRAELKKMAGEGEGTYINNNWLLLFLKENGANEVWEHSNLQMDEKHEGAAKDDQVECRVA